MIHNLKDAQHKTDTTERKKLKIIQIMVSDYKSPFSEALAATVLGFSMFILLHLSSFSKQLRNKF